MEKILNKKIIETIEHMSTEEQFYLYREYCNYCNLDYDRPELIYDIDELFYGLKPLGILERFEGIDLSWNYFNFDGYGNVQEWDGIDCISDVVREIIEIGDAFGNYEIQEILNTFSDLEELVNNAMEKVFDDSEEYNFDELYVQIVEEIENQTYTENENLFLDYEKDIKEYIDNYITDNQA